MKHKITFLSLLFTCLLHAQQAKLLKDVNPGSSSSADVENFVEFKGKIYFTANDNIHSDELWVSDGTASGTHLLVDIESGGAGSSPTNLTVLGDTLYFQAYTNTHGSELWVTDGTAEGTRRITDLNVGSNSSSIRRIIAYNHKLYFSANDGIHGDELWESDGTTLGTQLVKDINPGGQGSFRSEMIIFNGKLYFGADDGIHSSELWESDGTELGTKLTIDIVPDPNRGSNPQNLTVFNNKLFFSAQDASYERELWETDGTVAGTKLAADINPSGSSFPRNFTVLNNKLYLSANGGTLGTELWESDGTQLGTKLVKDIRTGNNGSFPGDFIVLGNKFYFSASDGVVGQELWESDGTEAGTQLVKDISVGDGHGTPQYFFVFNNKLFFRASDGITRSELWTSDGTSSGTEQLLKISQGSTSSNSRYFTTYNNEVYFRGRDALHGSELWKTDGTEAGTVLVKDIRPGTSGGVNRMLQGMNGKFYFQANDGIHGTELWETDGTESGTQMTVDINPGSDGSSPSNAVVLNNKLYFTAYHITYGTELWESDGTPEGTQLVKDIFTGVGYSSYTELIVYNNKIYFGAKDNIHETELWVSDGTKAGTHLFLEINDTPNQGSFPREFKVYNNKLYFSATDGVNGYELWLTDGTVGGTQIVKDINPGNQSSSPAWMAVYRNKLYFDANDGIHGDELWETDGTEAGTKLAVDIRKGSNGSGTREMVAHQDRLYFRADDGIHGSELWESDGTPEGTFLVADMRPGASSSSLDDIAILGNKLIFNADDGIYQEEPWVFEPFDCSTVGSTTIFVSTTGTEANSGYSWDEATSLQNALGLANRCSAIKEIWVQQGTYIAGINRTDDFIIPDNLKIYGGFNGTETNVLDRDWVQNPTALSGDIGIPNTISGNSFTLLQLRNTDNTVIDGFMIEEANAEIDVNTNSESDTRGGGLFLNNANNNTISNCIFKNNHGLEGAVVYQFSGTNNEYINCVFYGNEAQQTNPIFIEDGSASFTNCTVAYNLATGVHGIIGSKDGIITLKNSVVHGNHTLNYNSTGTGSLTATYSYLKGENPSGIGNIDGTTITDVLFRDVASDNYALQQNSPLIDTGDNSLNTTLKSLDGNTRIFDGDDNIVATIDIGAFEFDVNDIISITNTQLSPDNGFVELTFSKPVYNTVSNSDAVESSDFSLELTGGVAITPTITSVTNSVNETLVGGETIIRIHYTYTNPADGNEVLSVIPIANSLFNGTSIVGVNQTNNTANLIQDKVLETSVANNVEIIFGTYANIILGKNNHILVNPGTALTVGKMQTNGNSSIRLLSDLAHGPAQLEQQGQGQNTGVNFYQQIELPIKSKYAFQYFSSPVHQNGASTYSIEGILKDGRRNQLSSTHQGDDLEFVTGNDGSQEANKSKIASKWIYGYVNGGIGGNWDLKNHDGHFEIGEGFTMKSPGELRQRYVFKGNPNNGEYTKTLTAGTFSLLGNPYPSALDADAFINDNLDAITGTLYFYEDKSSTSHIISEYESGYNTYNLGGGVAAAETIHGETTSILFTAPEKNIAVGQGFFVEADADGGALSFKNSQRVLKNLSEGSQFFRTKKIKTLSDTEEKEFLKLGVEFNLDENTVYHRQLGITMIHGKTLGMEKGYESELFDEKTSDSYLQLSDKKLVLTTVDNTIQEQRVPLIFNLGEAKKVRVKLDSNMLKNQTIHIYDSETDQYKNINNDVFEVDLEEGTYDDRFQLVLNSEQTGSTLNAQKIEKESQEIRIISENHSFKVENKLYKLRVYNMLGQLLENKNLDKGIYVVKVFHKNSNKQLSVQKLSL